MIPASNETPVLGIPEAYYAAPLVEGLELRRDLEIAAYPAPDLEAALHDGRCACALVPPTALLSNPTLRVIPGAGVVARGATPSERLVAAGPLAEIRAVTIAPGAAHLAAYVEVLFAARGLEIPHFATGKGDPAPTTARLTSEDLDTAPAGFDLGTLWHESTGMPFVLACWACTGNAPHRKLRQVLGEAARWGAAALEKDNGTAGRKWARWDAGFIRRHFYFELLSLEADSIRTLHTLAREHAIGETTVESIAFC